MYIRITSLIAICVLYACQASKEYPQPFPVVSTGEVSDINGTGSQFNGSIESLGPNQNVIDYGFVWGTTNDPTINTDAEYRFEGGPVKGSFSAKINFDMTAGVFYHVRSFVRTDKLIVYGNSILFKSKGALVRWFFLNDPFTQSSSNYTGMTLTSNGTSSIYYCSNLLYDYDIQRETFTKKANMPGQVRNFPSSFFINGKLYYGFGQSGSTYFNDLWSYDPALNQWKAVTGIPVSARGRMICFTINNKAYLGFGKGESAVNDFWMFDPASGWTQIPATLKSNGTGNATSFVINGKAYLVGVVDPGSSTSSAADVYMFDPSNLSFTLKNTFPNFVAGYKSTASETKGYVVSDSKTGSLNKLYEYDPAADSWKVRSSYNFDGLTLSQIVMAYGAGHIFVGPGYNSNFFVRFWDYPVSAN